MIARVWHGRTRSKDYETYSEFLERIAIPDYKKTKGFMGLTFLRSISSGEAHFNLITYWENLDVIRNFAGENFEKAKYYPEDAQFLLEFEENVKHHEVFAAIPKS